MRDGPPPAYRTADLYFADYDTARGVRLTRGQAAAQDAMQIGSAGVQFLLSVIDAS